MNAAGLGMRVFAPLGAIAVLAILVLGAGTAGATTNPPAEAHSVLATIPLVATIAANSSMVFAQGVTNCSEIVGISPSGSVGVYATVPTGTGPCSEGALALSPNVTCTQNYHSGWAPVRVGDWGNGGGGGGGGGQGCNPCGSHSGDVLYDALNGGLYMITDGGANVTTVATFSVPLKASENMGLTYDQVGSFNHDLIVTSSAKGMVWSVNSTGNVTLLAELHTYIAGPAVAPWSFGPYGGDVLVAAKNLNEVVAISPSGNVSVVANWTYADSVAFPSNAGYGWGYGGGCGSGGGGCTFGNTSAVFFVGNYTTGAVEAFPASDFQNFSGQGFVAGGQNHGIASFTSDGATTTFATQTQRLSDIAFISCFSQSHGNGGHGGHGGGW